MRVKVEHLRSCRFQTKVRKGANDGKHTNEMRLPILQNFDVLRCGQLRQRGQLVRALSRICYGHKWFVFTPVAVIASSCLITCIEGGS